MNDTEEAATARGADRESHVNAASFAEVCLAVVCRLAEKLAAKRPVVTVLFGERSENFVVIEYCDDGRVKWIPASERQI
jgi:hypothetical protein